MLLIKINLQSMLSTFYAQRFEIWQMYKWTFVGLVCQVLLGESALQLRVCANATTFNQYMQLKWGDMQSLLLAFWLNLHHENSVWFFKKSVWEFFSKKFHDAGLIKYWFQIIVSNFRPIIDQKVKTSTFIAINST